MKRLDHAPFAPGECLVRHSAKGPFIDLGTDFDWRHNGRMYVSYEAVRQMAELFGLVPDQSGEMKRLRAELASKDEVIAAHERFRERVNKAGLVIKRAPGRPGRARHQTVTEATTTTTTNKETPVGS